MYQNDQTMKNLLIIPALLIVLSAEAQRVNLFLKEPQAWVEASIQARDHKSLYTDIGKIKFAEIDTARFIDYAAFDLLSALNDNRVIYYNAKKSIEQIKAEQPRTKTISGKKTSNAFKGVGFFMASIGLALQFQIIDEDNPPSIDDYNSNIIIGNTFIFGGGLFVMIGHFLDPDE
jgi:hypothetical protein